MDASVESQRVTPVGGTVGRAGPNGRIALAGSVTTTAALNLRQGSPDSAAPVVRTLPPGVPIAVVSIVGGQNVGGNALWYEVGEGFLWSGGCSGLVPGRDTGVPAAARGLLDLIASREAPAGYETLFGNSQNKLPKPLTSMPVAEVIAAGPGWSARFGSSACGRYQFMTATLKDLRTAENLSGTEPFGPQLQDRLGYALLDRRGYGDFLRGRVTRDAFGLAIAKEWASFPVLGDCQGAHRPVRRGETFYAGDGLNKALITPEAVEAALDAIRRQG